MSRFQRASLDKFMDRARAVNASAVERLLSAVKTNDETRCWELQRLISAGGYGAVRVNGVKQRAHRWLYEALYGSVGDLEIRHICHNPGCIFPAHLKPGTHKQNMDDRVRAGRGGDLRGENNGRAKLTDDDVREIRSSNEKGAVLGRRFGISSVMACKIRRGAAWRHVQ
jgi:hypothetical protein